MIKDISIGEIIKYDLETLEKWISELYLNLDDSPKKIVEPIINDLLNRTRNIIKIVLPYLSIDREVSILSAGEAQRLKISNIIDSSLTGVIYVLDEPTTGLHPKDIEKILQLLNKLKEKDNSIFVIENALKVITYADYIIDLGIDGGTKGGNIVACGTPKEIIEDNDSYTARYIKEFIKK